VSNKYYAYSIVAIKSIVSMSSAVMGLVMNTILGLIIVAFLTIFDVDVIAMIEVMSVGGATDQLTGIKIVSIITMMLLMGTVAAIMQSVMSDRDNKISEVISTSIYEKHYIFGKVAAAVSLMITMVLNTLAAIIISVITYSLVNNITLSRIANLVKTILLGVNGDELILAVLLMALALVTSILFALALAIKVNNLHEAGSTVLVILLPYFFLLALFFFMPKDIETWKEVSQYLMFVPILSPFFSIINVTLNGFELDNIMSIFLSFVYIFLLYELTMKIYKVAFYNNAKYGYIDLVKLISSKENKYVKT